MNKHQDQLIQIRKRIKELEAKAAWIESQLPKEEAQEPAKPRRGRRKLNETV